MAASNGMFARMCREAAEELASGEKGWKEMETNTLLMACFHLLTNHLTHAITRPLWFFSGTVFAGVVAWFINMILGG